MPPLSRRVSATAVAVGAALIAATPVAIACTTILVGRGLTADGSILHAHNEDMGNEAVGRLWQVPPATHEEGLLEVPYVAIPRAEKTFGYWASGNALGVGGLGVSGLGVSDKDRPYDSVLVGLNEKGLSLSCNWAHSRAENAEGVGLRRYAIRQLLLERASSARHGVELLGRWIEEHGQADWGGLIYHLADPREAWVVETTTRNWVARRVRDDEIRVTANRFRIGSDYDLASFSLVRDAVAAGWLEEPADRLDFARVFGRPGKMDQPYDTRREERAEALLAAKRGELTPEDLFPVLRDRYEGTDFYTPPQEGPVWREDLEANPKLSRTIATNLAQSSFVAHLRPDLPVEVGAMVWFAMATPGWAGYFPLYAAGGSVPEAFSRSALRESDDSAWWIFRRAQRSGDRFYDLMAPPTRRLWARYRRQTVELQPEVERRALDLLAEGKEGAAREVLADFASERAAKTFEIARDFQRKPPDNQQIVNRGEGKDEWWDALPRAAWSGFRRVEQSQEWFEVYEIRPGVLAIYEPGQFEEVISYLVVGSERALLFDTGLGIGDMRRLVEELTDREIVVLNSHTHYDHVGGNHAFERVYGTDLDYTRRHAAGRAPEAVAEFVGPGWIWKPTPEGFSTADYRSLPFTVTDRVEDGQVLSLGDVELEVLLTPGHAPDSLCLLDRDRGLLFTGDTFYPATLYAHLEGASFADYERTAARLGRLAATVEVVLPAHNEPTMPADELVVLRGAFDAMRRGAVRFVRTDGAREYFFGRFSILVPDPPPWPDG